MAAADDATTRFLALLRQQHRLARASAAEVRDGRDRIDAVLARAP
jgi:hypothetical protein